MALIETSMYGNYQAPDYLGNFQRGMQFGQQYRQNKDATEKKRKEEEEAKKFETTFKGLAQVNDISTPEGRTGLIRDLNTLGYGKQALGLMGQFQEMAPKVSNDTFTNVETDQGMVPFDRRYGTYGKPGQIDGKPLMKPQKAPESSTPGAWKGERFIRTKDNTMVKVDANGLDQAGNRPELWTAPTKATAPPKPPAPPKALSGDAAKLVSIAYTLPQDVSGMKAAFARDYNGSIAGMKTGTNTNLVKLKSQIADKLGRLRSGGAVNVDEEARFDALIAKVNDMAFTNAEDAMSTLDDIAYEAQIIMEGVDRDGSFRQQLKDRGLERKPSAREAVAPDAVTKSRRDKWGY